jgi:hypothetical protein
MVDSRDLAGGDEVARRTRCVEKDDMVRSPLCFSRDQALHGHGVLTPVGMLHRSNLGRGRQIHVLNPVFHESVRQRMRDPKLNYRPNAEWVKGTEVYVS